MVRLTAKEQQAITSTVLHYDPKAQVLLFGSRTDPDKKGGDIDLLVISATLGFADKLNILADLHGLLGEQKIDILLDKDGTGDFARTILPTAVELQA
ncbi:nucleotidyltransferase domain-containing protein [Parendozoicomonas sp. Alg238-R29]|uniref:nucleotidyltransferase domain-containing protein n=1 Tax=Parendozoicomonas sp. Alg238-R29 TaxID=2993446 RepID=UPI00248D58F8|nr:nucleotidyltransferase domain-containing protein [Parendozoicomonas sp. Alg238-R29]